MGSPDSCPGMQLRQTVLTRDDLMTLTLRSAVATFGKSAKAKLSNPGARGEPEDQLREPLDHLVGDLAELCGFSRSDVTTVGEVLRKEFNTRPDFAVTARKALVGFIEVKAPGKGADPRKFRDKHDKEQWKKLQSLPNLFYTDGNEFCLCRSGEVVGQIVRLDGDVETSGSELNAPPSLQRLFEDFIRWQPIPPRDASGGAYSGDERRREAVPAFADAPAGGRARLQAVPLLDPGRA